MIRDERSIEIKKPLAGVFRFMGTGFFQNYQRWNPAMVELRQTTKGPIRAGAKGEAMRKSPQGPEPQLVEVTKFSEPSKIAFVLDGKGSRIQFSYSLETTPTGTRVRQTFEMELKGLAKLLQPLLGGPAVKQVAEDLQTLKTVIEAS